MADPKLKAKPAAPPSGNKHAEFSGKVGGVLFVLFLLGLLLTRVETFLYFYGQPDPFGAALNYFLSYVWPWIKILAFLVSALSIYGIAHVYGKLSTLTKEEREVYAPKGMSAEGVVENSTNERWQRVMDHINSTNSADWRLAIIEADIMLDELLTASGHHGTSVGEKLKSVEKSDFVTLDSAWEAHKVRNSIAHKGSDFPLNEREAKRAISLFEEVFKEFKII